MSTAGGPAYSSWLFESRSSPVARSQYLPSITGVLASPCYPGAWNSRGCDMVSALGLEVVVYLAEG